jgi:hypothetical protein
MIRTLHNIDGVTALRSLIDAQDVTYQTGKRGLIRAVGREIDDLRLPPQPKRAQAAEHGSRGDWLAGEGKIRPAPFPGPKIDQC